MSTTKLEDSYDLKETLVREDSAETSIRHATVSSSIFNLINGILGNIKADA